MLRAVGRLPEALRHAVEATKLDPTGGVHWLAKGEVEREMGRLDEGLVSAEQANKRA